MAKSGDSPGFWFRLGPRTLTLGAGMDWFGKNTLERYRDEVVDPRARTRAGDCRCRGTRCRGWHDGLYAGGERDVPLEAHGPEFVRYCADEYGKVRPLFEWLSRRR